MCPSELETSLLYPTYNFFSPYPFTAFSLPLQKHIGKVHDYSVIQRTLQCRLVFFIYAVVPAHFGSRDSTFLVTDTL